MYQNLTQNIYRKLSFVVSSAPTILRPRVWTPSTPSRYDFLNLYYRNCNWCCNKKRTEIRAELDHFWKNLYRHFCSVNTQFSETRGQPFVCLFIHWLAFKPLQAWKYFRVLAHEVILFLYFYCFNDYKMPRACSRKWKCGPAA